MDTWHTVHKDLVWLPSKNKYDRAASATPEDRIASVKVCRPWGASWTQRSPSFNILHPYLQAEYDAARSEMEKEAKRAAKVDQKANILVGGLQQRDVALRAKLTDLAEQLESAKIELACYQALKERELRAAPERIEKALDLVQAQRQREADLQEKYKALLRHQSSSNGKS